MSDPVDISALFAGNTMGAGGSTYVGGGGAPVYPSANTAAAIGNYNAGFNDVTGDPSSLSSVSSLFPAWLGGTAIPSSGAGGGATSLQGALSTLAKNQGAGAAGGGGTGLSSMNIPSAQLPNVSGAARNTSGASELATLLAALDARRNMLLQSAVSGKAAPVASPASPAAGGGTRSATGLLGI